MTRQRWFCCLCGNLTKREPRPDGRALCTAHMTVALDAVPPDPLESLPVKAVLDPFERPEADDYLDAGEWAADFAAWFDRKEAARQQREDLPPASGTDG